MSSPKHNMKIESRLLSEWIRPQLCTRIDTPRYTVRAVEDPVSDYLEFRGNDGTNEWIVTVSAESLARALIKRTTMA